MRNITNTVVAATMLALMITSASADVFVHPPETDAPQWFTAFPYPRNINMGMQVNPVGPAGSGIPGAVYEGWLDPTLKESDFAAFGGSVGWYDTLAGISHTGLVGIDNRTGTGFLTGMLSIHVDNTPEANAFKDVWVEALVLTSYNGAGTTVQVLDPQGVPAVPLGPDINVEPVGDEWLSDYEFRITPNPLFETVVWSFEAPPGTYIFVDAAHVATECVPEPAALGLLSLVALSTLRRGGRQRASAKTKPRLRGT